MTDGQKKAGAVVLVVAALIGLGYSIYTSISANNPQEQIVGTLDMGPKGGRDAEKAVGDVASGMPADKAGPDAKEGKQ